MIDGEGRPSISPRLRALDIAGKMPDVVRVDATQVREDEVVGDDLGIHVARTRRAKDVAGDRM
jgi:hypothetical protein